MREIIDMLRPGDINPFFGESKQFPERFIRPEDLLAQQAGPGDVIDDVKPGDLDTSFGNKGVVTRPSIGIGLPTGDGRYWVVSKLNLVGRGPRLHVIRLLSYGSPDPDFALGGKIVDLHPFADHTQLTNAVLQSSGNIIVAGYIYFTDAPDERAVFVARINKEGELDLSFGNEGIKLIQLSGNPLRTTLYDIAVQPDDKIIVTAMASWRVKSFPRIIRLNADGALDVDFAKFGVAYDLPAQVYMFGTLALSNKKLLLHGLSATDEDAVVMRLHADGRVDRTFGEEGIVRLSHPLYRRMGAVAAAEFQKSDGSVVVGGYADSHEGVAGGFIARILSSGHLDPRFNRGRILFFTNDWVDEIATQDDKIVFQGTARRGPSARLIVGRIRPDGLPDPTFGDDGFVIYERPVQTGLSSQYANIHIESAGQEQRKLLVSNVNQLDEDFDTQLLRIIL